MEEVLKNQEDTAEGQPWESIERTKTPWVPIQHGETVKPQMDQTSNNDLTDEQVLQPRDEPIGGV